MKHTYTAVIQAGGLGTRMRELTKDRVPKPMLSLNGKPMLAWQIEQIAGFGIREVVIITGHLGEQIEEYFQDGQEWGVHIRYVREDKPLGSAGALAFLKPFVATTDFLLVFGDVMFDLDGRRLFDFHENQPGQITLLAHPNSHPGDSDRLIAEESGRVLGIDSKRNQREDWYDNLVNAGIYVLSSHVLDSITEVRKRDLEQDVLGPLIEAGRVYAYRTPEYVKDAGTPERFREVSDEQKAGVWRRKNLTEKQRCVFLDRDGTLNEYRGLISKEEQLVLEKGAAEAVRWLNRAGYLVILVTNQPVVARGLCRMEDVRRLHRKIQVLLGEQGAYLDDIRFCPHHPDKGYPEEDPRYKIICNCRKPATGMIDQMVEKYHIDRKASYLIGDSTVDVQTGVNAGLKTILVLTGEAGRDGKYSVRPDEEAADLLEAVRRIAGSFTEEEAARIEQMGREGRER